MLQIHHHPQTCGQLLESYRGGRESATGAKLRFEGVDGRDVYNITAAFADDGAPVLAGRVEARDTEFSCVKFFRRKEGGGQEDGSWQVDETLPEMALQDPFYTRIGEELVFGGVRVIEDEQNPGKIESWETVFSRGASVADLQPFLVGPSHMKDIRMVQLADGAIGVFTRPQGEKGGRGKIGFFKAASLEAVTQADISEAPLLEGMFIDEEWGGANEAHLLANGLIGVLGHIAWFDEDGYRHYYAMTFALNPDTLERTPLKLVAERSDFPDGPAKRGDLQDVIFSGGLIRNGNGWADLYVGASDAEAYVIAVPDPLLEYEGL
ncbi:DUF1861 family protein [Paenibacillus sp. PAMC21692]|uniref:DUF1861 family protein n=1 Tax=Paenibacillus sp. PAMC21692 TaxID=2762320 RepID=UPI00164CFC86|nr:DUF1861 family protein [Paenibacillus sp. PAMC21692]QNK59000.1 DUF1861 family protein [Paenibacillus sp. PAMC21692]